jgi:hypothetical protein
VRNGGDLLLRSVLSCGAVETKGVRMEVLVLDNCSDDDAINRLPAVLPNAIPVRVIRNERDLGRVGNWNRCMGTARALDFQFATFLFAGDTWTRSSAAADLISVMQSHGADLGLAPYLIVNEEGEVCRRSARISFPGKSCVLPATALLQAMMDRGSMPVTPLQANIYRLRNDNLPLFDEGRPLTTDMDATLEYLARGCRSIALIAEPFCAWLSRKGRTFCTSGFEPFMADHFRQLRYAEEISGMPVNWTRAKSTFVMSYLQNAVTFGGWRSVPAMASSIFYHASAQPGFLDPIDLVGLIAGKIAGGRSVLHVGG